jgi:hypothetical protein
MHEMRFAREGINIRITNERSALEGIKNGQQDNRAQQALEAKNKRTVEAYRQRRFQAAAFGRKRMVDGGG